MVPKLLNQQCSYAQFEEEGQSDWRLHTWGEVQSPTKEFEGLQPDRTDQHTVLWRSDKALLGQDEPVFKLHYSRQGNLKLTGVQIPGVLDDLFFYEGLLGAHLGPQGVDISLWAPTAQQIVPMDDDMTMPEGWASHTPLPAAPWTDTSVYELHIRDFSMSDETVPEELRGKYKAFTLQDSAGVAHLRSLRSAGLTHIHLLPAYDYGSVPERAEDQTTIKGGVKAGREFMYSSQPSAYAKQPWETVNYADCHDGQTLFDQEVGLIVMQLSSASQPGSTQGVYDPEYSHIWVLLNSNPHKVSFEAPAGDVPLQLHPLQNEQSYYSGCKSCSNKMLEVSAHAAAVFVQQHD
ncbi:hypothetical protein WJX77_012089 [Trebouxia sp. C0004]